AVGAVGIGGSVAVVNIGSKAEAYIDHNATVIAGADADDRVSVEASLVTDIEGRAWGGQAGGIALGAQVVYISDHSQQLAHIESGANINRAGDTVLVHANADRQV